ncbi:MAG: GNAT family N-acetyltransferase [Eggerthellaceae bacterium]
MPTQIRRATEADVPLILDLIRGLADYEHALDQVVATPELLHSWLFEKEVAEVIIAQEDNVPVGFALYFHNFSTWLGRAGIYLEDLFVLPPYRGRGHGKALMRALAKTAMERGCGRLEWACLNWNKPSIDFYLSLGAERMTEWNVYRLTGETLRNLAESE